MRFLYIIVLITSSLYSQEKFTVYFDTDKGGFKTLTQQGQLLI